ncbi:MAG TPA: hypothetical protein VGJ72_08150 [Polaromonas sp.]|jgi:hypothetical protein
MKPLWMIALCAVLASHVPALQAQTTWKLATGYQAESFHTQNILQFSREWVRSVGNEANDIFVPYYIQQ